MSTKPAHQPRLFDGYAITVDTITLSGSIDLDTTYDAEAVAALSMGDTITVVCHIGGVNFKENKDEDSYGTVGRKLTLVADEIKIKRTRGRRPQEDAAAGGDQAKAPLALASPPLALEPGEAIEDAEVLPPDTASE